MTIGDIIARLLRLYGLPEGESEAQAVAPAEGSALTGQFSLLYPIPYPLVICDEITTALDISVQATSIELLLELRCRYHTAYLFITHNST